MMSLDTDVYSALAYVTILALLSSTLMESRVSSVLFVFLNGEKTVSGWVVVESFGEAFRSVKMALALNRKFRSENWVNYTYVCVYIRIERLTVISNKQ